MPYDTRRKSLSLPSLGIQLPSASRAHRSTVSKASPTREAASPPRQQQPPSKKVKRSHHSEQSQHSSSPTSPSRSSSATPINTQHNKSRPRSSTTSSASGTKNVSFADRPKSSGRTALEDTPPPSPGATTDRKYDTNAVGDEIVAGVIEQLEKTGNRPHLVRELATVLSNTSGAVSSSANPGALLSSRLAAYLKRPGWSALAPCPLEKELTAIHPRKVYYYLTTMSRQDLPVDSSDLFRGASAVYDKGGKRIISPSISSASVDGDLEAAEERAREAMSPSPEVDLSTHAIEGSDAALDIDFVAPGTPAASFSGRSSLTRDGSISSQAEGVLSHRHHHRSASPPLEGDEKEFTQTASSVRLRGMSLDNHVVRPTIETAMMGHNHEDDEEAKAKANQDAVEALFGTHPPSEPSMALLSSPQVRPLQTVIEEKVVPRISDVESCTQSVSKPALTQDIVRVSNATADVKDTLMTSPTEDICMSVLGNPQFELTWEARDMEDIRVEDLDELFDAY